MSGASPEPDNLFITVIDLVTLGKLILSSEVPWYYILEWIIVYDGSKISENFQQFSNYKKIVELVFNSNDNEVQGNAQRNFGLNYHRAFYHESYDDNDDICYQRLRAEDRPFSYKKADDECSRQPPSTIRWIDHDTENDLQDLA